MSVLDDFKLNGKVAVVTGSGQGIGRGIAWGLAEAGCDVVINARRKEDLEVTAKELEGGEGSRGRRGSLTEAGLRRAFGLVRRCRPWPGPRPARPRTPRGSWP